MDRFKFRVWNKKSNAYIKEKMFYVDKFGGLFKYEKSKSTIYINSPYIMCLCVNNYILEQCTGLKDKNGKLIYEGDILKGSNGSINGQEWEFTHVVKWNDKSRRLVLPDFEPDEDWSHYYNVIGNIHENPELLKEKE